MGKGIMKCLITNIKKHQSHIDHTNAESENKEEQQVTQRSEPKITDHMDE